VTEHTEPRITADLHDAIGVIATALARYRPGGPHEPTDLDHIFAAGLTAALEEAGFAINRAARLDALWAVLDALSDADLNVAAHFVRQCCRKDFPNPLADRLEAAAAALHALEAEHG